MKFYVMEKIDPSHNEMEDLCQILHKKPDILEDFVPSKYDYIDDIEWEKELQSEYEYVKLQDRQRFVEIIEGNITHIAELIEKNGKVYAFIHDSYGTEFEKMLQDDQDAEYMNDVEWEKELHDEFKFGVMLDESRSFKDSFVFPKKYNYSQLEYSVRWIDELKQKEVLFEQRESDLEADLIPKEELEKEHPAVKNNC